MAIEYPALKDRAVARLKVAKEALEEAGCARDLLPAVFLSIALEDVLHEELDALRYALVEERIEAGWEEDSPLVKAITAVASATCER